MARNFIVFLIGLVILFAFSCCFAYVGIYNQSLISGILAIVGFLTSLVISLLIGLASREEGGSNYLWYFGIAVLTAIIFVWYLSRAGVVLQIW